MKRRRVIRSFVSLSAYVLMTLSVLMLCSVKVQAQELTVKGTVMGADDGAPVPGATVVIKGTTVGTITDFDGNFSIKAKKGDILLFSFVGMTTQEKEVAGNTLNVSLKSETIGLEEVVAIGYGTVKKKELTGAVAQVKAEEITRTVTSDLATALQGQVAGVNVTASSGAPGSGSEVLIRGLSSISGTNQPLYVVDGVPFDGDPGLNPNEIETVDILKDASSCAIYGTRGAAGVILVTTKKGKAGSLRVAVNGSYGIQDITSGTPLMNAAEQTYFDLVQLRNVSGGLDDQVVLDLAKIPANFRNDTNLGDIAFTDYAPVQDYNINVSGGTKDITYNLMAGYYNKEGVVTGSNFDRFNVRANTTYNNGKWTISGSVGMTTANTDKVPGTLIIQTIRYLPTSQNLVPGSNEPVVTIGGDESNRLNWVLESFNTTDEVVDNSAFANLSAKYDLTKDLELSVRSSLNTSNGYEHQFKPYRAVYKEDGTLISDPSNSFVAMYASRGRKVDFEAGVRYLKKFNKHKLTLQAVYTVEDRLVDRFYARKEGVIDSQIKVLNGTSLNPEAGSGFNYRDKQIGTLGRVLYDYKSRYLLSVSARYDGSSKFSDKYRWGLFPSVSGAWNISDEKFWKPIKQTVNNMKLRIGRGTVGNNSFQSYSYAASMSFGKDYVFGSDQMPILGLGTIQTGYANAEVKWETSIQTNLGVDMAFFNNKLTLTGELYDTKKKDMLFPVTLPASATGSSSGNAETVIRNVGNMTNTGLEFALGYHAKTGKVNWNVNGTFATNKNEITKMITQAPFLLTNDGGLISGAKATSQVTAIAVGYEAGSFFLYRTDGIVDTEQKLAEYQQLFPQAKMGDLIYKDSNGDGEISELDRVYSGSGLPEYEIGLSYTADYKGFDFTMQWYAALGHEIMNGAKAVAYGWGRHKDLIYAWSKANPESPIPAYRGDSKGHQNYYGYNDLWLEDGSYLRLKTVTLGYSLPQATLQKLGLSKARIYVSAQNPLTFTKYEGFDPEVGGNINNRGLDKGNYPVTSMYLVGLNLNF